MNLLVDEHGLRPENIAFWRFVVGAIVLVLVFGRRVSWSRLRPVLGTVVKAGVVLSSVLLGQHLSALQWFGGALLLSSVWVLGRRTTAVVSPTEPQMGDDPKSW